MAVKPAASGRLLKAGIAVLIAGAILLLFGAIGAFYFWNNNKHVRGYLSLVLMHWLMVCLNLEDAWASYWSNLVYANAKKLEYS